MNIKRQILAFAAAIFAISAPKATAFTTNLFAVADTSLRNNAADFTFGNSNPLLVGVSKEPFTVTNRALLKFDLSGIPTNAFITRATLTVTIFRSNTGPVNCDLNRVLVDWAEYEASWSNRLASIPWSVGGGESGMEYVPMPSVTAPVDDAVFSSAGMISDVQMWLNHPGANFGWMMIATGEPLGSGKQIGSRESDSPPVLTVDYTLSPPAVTPVLFGASRTGNEFQFSFQAESNRTYTVEFIDEFAGSGWDVLTNIPAQPVSTTIAVTNSSSSSARYFRVGTP